MWHTIQRIAESRRLDEKAFEAFVERNKEKYHVDQYGMIGTWNVGIAVNDFKQARPALRKKC